MSSFMRVRKNVDHGEWFSCGNVNTICLSRMLRAEIAQSVFRPERVLGDHLFLWGCLIPRTDLSTHPTKERRQAVNDLVTREATPHDFKGQGRKVCRGFCCQPLDPTAAVLQRRVS